jgi:hypothetical protein
MSFWIIAGWLVCACISSGFTFAHFYGRFEFLRDEWRSQLVFAVFIGLLGGPWSLVISLALSGFGRYGWRLWPQR